MAQFRPPTAPPNRRQAAADINNALASPRIPTSVRALVSDVGGTRAAAQLVGRSERQVQRWMSGDIGHIPDQLRASLARAGTAARNRVLIQELGGTRRVAELTGRSVRTVERWASGQIAQPRRDARQLLGRADAAVRMRSRGLSIDPATGRPVGPVYLRVNGSIRINASSRQQYNYPSRNIGTGGMNPQGFEITEVMAAITDALGEGDPAAAQEALEAYLSDAYAAAGRYDPVAEIGVFIDRVDGIEFNQDLLDDTDEPEGPAPRR